MTLDRSVLVGALLAMTAVLAVVSTQRDDARDDVARMESNEQRIARVCTFRTDGSAACPPKTFRVDRVATSTTVQP